MSNFKLKNRSKVIQLYRDYILPRLTTPGVVFVFLEDSSVTSLSQTPSHDEIKLGLYAQTSKEILHSISQAIELLME